MIAPPRLVRPELLDAMAPDDRRAQQSRADLRRVHRFMGTVATLRRAIAAMELSAAPRSVLELGAGDGTLLLRAAASLKMRWREVTITLLDQHDLVSSATRESFKRLGWQVTVMSMDALQWARQRQQTHYDLSVTTLFLHHFDAAELAILLAAVAARTDAFVACEPRRNPVAMAGSRLVGLLGANAITRADAVTSVAAGFSGQELTTSWSRAPGSWKVREYWAAPFTHCFTAVRAAQG